MTGHIWKGKKMAKIDLNDQKTAAHFWTWLEMAFNVQTLLELAKHCWKRLELAATGLNWLNWMEIARQCLKWLQMTKTILEMAGIG